MGGVAVGYICSPGIRFDRGLDAVSNQIICTNTRHMIKPRIIGAIHIAVGRIQECACLSVIDLAQNRQIPRQADIWQLVLQNCRAVRTI